MASVAAPVALGVALLGQAGQTAANVQTAKAQQVAAEAEARSIEQAATFSERQFRRQAGLVESQGRTIAAASGLDPSRGSPLLLDLENAKQREIEALNIRRTGQIGAGAKRFEAKLARMTIPGSILGGIAGAGSILSTFLGAKAVPTQRLIS